MLYSITHTKCHKQWCNKWLRSWIVNFRVLQTGWDTELPSVDVRENCWEQFHPITFSALFRPLDPMHAGIDPSQPARHWPSFKYRTKGTCRPVCQAALILNIDTIYSSINLHQYSGSWLPLQQKTRWGFYSHTVPNMPPSTDPAAEDVHHVHCCEQEDNDNVSANITWTMF